MKRCSAYTSVQWDQYIADELPESFRERMETHLLGCPQCLDLYISAVESTASHEEELYPTDHLTDEIMASIHSAGVPVLERGFRPSANRSTFAHYVIAASITLVLVGSGVFDIFFEGTHVYAAQHEAVAKASEWQQHWLQKVTDRLSENFKIIREASHEKK